MAGNRIYVQGSYIDVHDNENVYLNVDKAEVNMEQQGINDRHPLDRKALESAVMSVQHLFWAAASYAVIFCVCRDRYDYTDNMSQFERLLMSLDRLNSSKYPCKNETVTSTIKNNAYMKLPIGKWETNGAKERTIVLRDEFIKAVEQRG